MIAHRRVLLAATGLSPQILTETLFALGIKPGEGQAPFIPTEIHVITTAQGADVARTSLLHSDGGAFYALLNDYPQLGNPAFDENHIHIIHDAAGRPLADIRSPEENASAADSITALMSGLTRDDAAVLHVSIAGGRKTMGFYLGYAFSLFARPQDELSHVLVSSPFEGHPAFFYPPPKPRRLATRDGRYIDTAGAVVTLARIPVVRLRHGQPKALLAGRASFNDTVSAIQESLAPPRLYIDLRTQRVLCGNTEVHLPSALVAWFAWWAQQRLERQSAQSWRTADAREFLRLYAIVVGPASAAYENTSRRLREGMEKSFFQENNSKLERKLKAQLGPSAAAYLLATTGKRPQTSRSLSLPTTAIEVGQ